MSCRQAFATESHADGSRPAFCNLSMPFHRISRLTCRNGKHCL